MREAYVARARDNFLSGYSCSQAVACAFASDMNLSEEQVALLASSFGGGMGKLREVCGAMSGALLALGALRGYSDPNAADAKAEHYERVQEFARRFKQVHESILCRELLQGIELKKEDSAAPEERTPEYYRTRPCVRFVETAAGILWDMLFSD